MANRNFEVGEIYIVPRGMGGELFDNDIIVITEITPQPTGKILVGYVIVNNYRSTYRCKRGYFSARSPMAYSLIKLNPKEIFPEKEISVTFHDKTTVAKLKEYGKVVKTGVAKCHPEDKYDALYGTCCAVGRVFNEEVDVPKTYTAEEAVGLILSVYYNKVRGNFWCGITGLSEEIVDKALNIIMEEFMKEYQ